MNRLCLRTFAVPLYVLFGAFTVGAQPVDSPAKPNELTKPSGAASVIPIALVADIGVIRKELERGLPTGTREHGIIWITGQRMGCCDVQIGVNRSGYVAISVADNALKWSVPLSINNGRVDWSKKLLFVTVRHHEEFGGAFRISGTTGISFDVDWSVDAGTVLDYTYTERPWITLHAGPLKTTISVGGPVGKAIDKKIQVLRQVIDGKLEAAVRDDLKNGLHSVWDESYQTFQISIEPPVWVQTRPVGILFHGLRSGADGTLVVQATIKIYTDVFVGSSPPEPLRLPIPPNPGTQSDYEAGLGFLLHLPLNYATQIAQAALIGKQIRQLPFSKITQVAIDARTPNQLVAEVGFELGGLVKGSIGLIGAPRFDMATRELVIDLDVSRENAGALADFLPETIRFDLSTEYEHLLNHLRRALSDVKFPGIKTLAEFEGFDTIEIYVSDSELVAHVQVAGQFSFQVGVSDE